MNKQYKIEEDGIVTIITDSGEVITKECNQNIDEILSLEDYIEITRIKMVPHRNNIRRYKEQKKTHKRLLFGLPITLIVAEVMLLMAILPSIKLLLPILGCSLLAIGLLEIPSIITIIKSNNKIEQNNKMLLELSHKEEKAKKRLETLSKEKTIEPQVTPGFVEVKKIYSYHFDSQDYFIENYLIDKRAKEMTGGKTLVKKPSKIVNGAYEI